MSGNSAIKGGGGGGRLMANAILNFHFDYLHTSLSTVWQYYVSDLIFGYLYLRLGKHWPLDCLKVVVVANYSPAGNYIGQYVDNVPPPQ